MKVGRGFLGFLTLGGRPRAARRSARTRFLYCFQSQPRKTRVQMVMTPALEAMAEMVGVLARCLYFESQKKWGVGEYRSEEKCVSNL